MKRTLHSEKGLTLMEIIISLFIFSLMVGSITGIFVNGVKGQKKLLEEQKLSSEISFVLEYMSRAMRMAKSGTGSGDCASGDHYKSLDGGQRVEFLNYEGECQRFFLEDGKIMEKKANGNDAPLTSSNIEVSTLNFNNGESNWFFNVDSNQPKVIIFIQAEHAYDEDIRVTVQTTISKRELSG